MNIQEDYVSFETAKLLKEKGFNESCQMWYGIYQEQNRLDEDEPNKNSSNGNALLDCACPTLQMAMKWLREVHKIHIAIYPYGEYSCDNYQFDVYKDNDFVVSKDDGYMTYEEAVEAAIKYCLENLI